MKRAVLAVLAGLATWTVIATIANMLVRVALPGYAAVEASMAFTLPMMQARLLVGALSSVGAGMVCAALARGNPRPAQVLAALLVAMFVPVHIGLWTRFPVWYHAAFLLSLAPLVLLGARVTTRTDRPE